MTNHHLKWGPFPPNEVSKITQHVRKEEGKKEGKDWSIKIIVFPQLLTVLGFLMLHHFMFLYEYVYVYIYIYMYIYTHTHTSVVSEYMIF